MGWRDWFRPTLPEEVQEVNLTALALPDGETVEVVGESHYQDELREVCGSSRWEEVRCEVTAGLVAEPDNPYDPNAIMVVIGGMKVGYLSRGDALDYQPAMQQLQALGYDAGACGAMICGRGPGSETSNLGVFLHLADPDELLEHLAEVDAGG
jgi:hypothetical protein